MDRKSGMKIFRRKLFVLHGGGSQDFPSEKFCFTMPNFFVGEHFCAVFEKISGSEKLYG